MRPETRRVAEASGPTVSPTGLEVSRMLDDTLLNEDDEEAMSAQSSEDENQGGQGSLRDKWRRPSSSASASESTPVSTSTPASGASIIESAMDAASGHTADFIKDWAQPTTVHECRAKTQEVLEYLGLKGTCMAVSTHASPCLDA